MQKREKQAIILTVLLVLGGAALSFVFPAHNTISKSGSLIIVVGIWFALLDFSEVEKKVETFTASAFIAVFSSVFAKLPDASSMDSKSKDEFKKKVESEYKKDLSDTLKKTKKRFLYIEAIIIIIGTLVNGFGDIMQKLLFLIIC